MTEVLVVELEPARNVSEAEGIQVCLPPTPTHESPGEEYDDNTVIEAILQFFFTASALSFSSFVSR